MKIIALLALTFLGVSAAFAAPGPMMYCPTGDQLRTAINSPTPYFVSPASDITDKINHADVGSIRFKEALLQSGIVKCVYSSSKGAVIVNLVSDYANAKFVHSSLNASSAQNGNGTSSCGVGATPEACPFLTKT